MKNRQMANYCRHQLNLFLELGKIWELEMYLLWRLANKKQIMAKTKKSVITWGRKNKGRGLDERGELVYINHSWMGE